MLHTGSVVTPSGSLIRNAFRVVQRCPAIANTRRRGNLHNQLTVPVWSRNAGIGRMSTVSSASNFSTESSTRRESGKEKVVILGSGWAGYEVAMRLDPKLFDVTLVSPANHKVFTPMLPSSATGYMDFQSISNPVRTLKGVQYQQAKARSIDFDARVVTCSDVFKNHEFAVHYDRLVVAVGCKTNTFNTPGVAEREGDYVFFLKHLRHAAMIKNRIIECFERADIPGVSDAEKQRLLSFVVVGGGPTSCEFAADLHDFVRNDISKVYSDLMPHFSLNVVRTSSPNGMRIPVVHSLVVIPTCTGVCFSLPSCLDLTRPTTRRSLVAPSLTLRLLFHRWKPQTISLAASTRRCSRMLWSC